MIVPARAIDQILGRIKELILNDQFVDLESDTVEIKPVPSDGASWKERQVSVNAFLNTRGGILILGIQEVKDGGKQRYRLSGYQSHAEPKLKQFAGLYKDRQGHVLDLTEYFPAPEIVDFLGGKVAVVYVDEMTADKKFCFLEKTAYRRILTGDHKITEREIERQEEYRDESIHARELEPVSEATLADLDLDRLNDFIQTLNRTMKIETLKPDLKAAHSFLERKKFIKDERVTTLGMLVCGKHPGDFLGFRAQVHGYVQAPQEIARDKQDFVDNILQLMEEANTYVLRNIHVGISPEAGGKPKAEYPEELLRETINNALAHRDYSINRQVTISITPGYQISISNPGAFRGHLLLATRIFPLLLRVIPEAKPRNPKLADVLRVYRKWEGEGIGMATLVNLCLENRIDLPYYRLGQDMVSLHLTPGKLLDESMDTYFQSFAGYIEMKLNGRVPTLEQRLVLSYLIKSERANRLQRHTIMLTPDNNHFEELVTLESAGLILRHEESPERPILYHVDPQLMRDDFTVELREVLGASFDALSNDLKEVLNIIYLRSKFSKAGTTSAKQASFILWEKQGRPGNVREFDRFYRRIRRGFNQLDAAGFIAVKLTSRQKKQGYALNENFLRENFALN